MAVKILWYLTAPDGPVPWEPEGRWETGFDHLQELAAAIDKLGYYGALLATGFDHDDVLAVAAATFPVTQRMKFLAAIHPGLMTPAKLARIALTIDKFSGGRLLFNAVNGRDTILPSLGVHFEHDERYEYSAEYWQAFQASYLGQQQAYQGKYIHQAARPPLPDPRRSGYASGALAPTQKNGLELWGAGTSSAGVAHSVELLDVYLSFADTPQRLGDKFRRVGAEAAKLGRKLRFGTRLQIIVRETEEEAWDYAQWLVDRTSVDYAIQSIQRQLPPGETLETYRSPNPQVQRNLDAIRAGRLPSARDYEIHPNLWTGPALHGFNVLAPLSGTTLVGSAENVAARIREFEAQGTSAFILSGWPLIEEAHRVADLLFPLLDLDHGFDVPLLNSGRYRGDHAARAKAA
ncbi:alkanesulfonate monooxygenase [Panacagrimonas perspica]|uniref:Alkanesulfonate monooxygenase n=1 Tax=Panacagrimonas perspica TaxID=381431 RepID=A0A4R7PCH0_9GAMM|nr:LLM class flavin-dependent oxidoreductase [Panacagrimonas perspica]TDU31718.1 alkanesulfonate monooxygenase [Panacagrimonas perspica]THD03068.1 monooxygenase [Panacagrimonas perspica]